MLRDLRVVPRLGVVHLSFGPGSFGFWFWFWSRDRKNKEKGVPPKKTYNVVAFGWLVTRVGFELRLGFSGRWSSILVMSPKYRK